MGKYLEKAVDGFINSNYENAMSVDDEDINYLSFFGTTQQMKQLLVEECKYMNHTHLHDVYKFVNVMVYII